MMLISIAFSSPENNLPGWEWQTWEGLPYLTCSLLAPWPHGFFTQGFYPQSPEDLAKVFKSQGLTYRLKQVHGNRVMTGAEIRAEMVENEALPEGDGILLSELGQSGWVASADCTPVLIADPVTGQTAALHAGWRGTAQKITVEAVSRLVKLGARVDDLLVALGPAISGEVYQVFNEVAIEVGSTILPHPTVTGDEALATLQSLPNPPVLPDPVPGRVRLDVRRVNFLQLEQMGVKPEKIAIAPCCTYQQPDYFFSYRRTQEKKVQWSGIMNS